MSDARNATTAQLRRWPLLSEIAALLLVPAAALGFIRIFEDSADVVPIAAAGLASSLLAMALRYARVPLIVAGPITLLVLAAGLMNWLAPETARLGLIPTEETREALRLVLDETLDEFQSQRAPVTGIDGFIAAAVAGAWIAAFIVDWAALRLRLAFEPVLPAGLLFVFSSVIGSGQHRITTTAIFGGAVVLWKVANRLARERLNLWLTADRQRGPSRIATGAAGFGAVAVALGLVGGPLLPGAGESELLDWRNNGDPTRVVISPFVNIGSRLVNQTDVDLFKVTTSRPSYYRLAGLDTYENGQWLAKGQESSDEDGDLPGQRPRAGTTELVTQEFEVQALGGDWLPAAFAPTRIDSETGVNWIADTGSLIVDESEGEATDLEYVVDSVVPLYTTEELRAATTNGTPAVQRRYLDVPDEVSPVVAQRARELTEGAATDYDRLILLEKFFRGFDYSVSLSPRRGDPTEQFLNERVGFCQQFSGTFALMARALGIPSRVAVGFTWGQPLSGEPGTYQITGRHTHAWPEVYFDELGWVSFEPTPQRGSPAAEGYSDVEAQQDEPTQPDNPFESTTTTIPGEGPDQTTPGNTLPLDDPAFGTPGGGTDGGDGGGPVSGRLVLVLALSLIAAVGLPALQRARVARRRNNAHSPADRVDTAWAEIAEALEHHHGILRDASETRTDFCERLGSQTRFSHLPFSDLAPIVTTARYAPEVVSVEQAKTAEAASDQVVQAFRGAKSPVARWWHDADPRRLLRPTVRVRVR
ncbi:MAG: transglutaminase domain-containing protein [Acidimicrobiales bacterium]|nr:transglutaminase domain-containing protein [Acidimicrobiales bacterium]